jgi:hypothetical protein
MAKGFGVPSKNNIGYVLAFVLDDRRAYFTKTPEEVKHFWKKNTPKGSPAITNDLNGATIWQSKKQARIDLLHDYPDLLLDLAEMSGLDDISVLLCSLQEDKKGNLIAKTEETIILSIGV